MQFSAAAFRQKSGLPLPFFRADFWEGDATKDFSVKKRVFQ